MLNTKKVDNIHEYTFCFLLKKLKNSAYGDCPVLRKGVCCFIFVSRRQYNQQLVVFFNKLKSLLVGDNT